MPIIKFFIMHTDNWQNMAIQTATLNKSYRIASSAELGYHLLLQVILPLNFV